MLRRVVFRHRVGALALATVATACSGPDEPPQPAQVFRNVGAAVAYVGDQACFDCHEEQYRGFQSHGMAQSFYAYGDSRRRPLRSTDTTLAHKRSGLSYLINVGPDSLIQTERGLHPGSAHSLSRRADYVVGSGNAAKTFLAESNGRLFELPVTWYTDDNRWDFSPGYDRSNARFGRQVPDRCMACHNSYPATVPHVDGKFIDLPSGIGCERCHGPGGLHVRERLETPESDDTVDDSIVNPAHLDTERRNAVCDQCHLQTTISVLRRNRGAFDFQPSEKLSDHVALFFEPDTDNTRDGVDVISHVDRMQQSACFLATRGTDRELGCLTCHDPHEGFRDAGHEYFDDTCLGCHAPSRLALKVAPESKSDHQVDSDCFGCHMPRVRAQDAPHASFTDHWIRVVGNEHLPASTHTDEPLLPYFDRDSGNREGQTYLGMALLAHGRQTNDPRRMATGIATLEAGLQSDTTWAEAHFMVGVGYQQLGRPDLALPYLERAATLEPQSPRRLAALAQAYQETKAGRQRIEDLYERALEIQPALYDVRLGFGGFLQHSGRLEEAVQAFSESLLELPWQPEASILLGTALLEMGRFAESREAFCNAVHLDPALLVPVSRIVLVDSRRDDHPVEIVHGFSSEPLARERRTWPDIVPAPRTAVTAGGNSAFVLVLTGPGVSSVRILSRAGTQLVSLNVNPIGQAAAWDLLDSSGAKIGSGLYLLQTRAGGQAGKGAATAGIHRLVIVRRDR